MKNAIVPGLIIGLLSGVWLFIMHAMGLTFSNDTVNPIEFVSVLIPIIGLYYGVKVYCYKELEGQMNFFEGLVHCFKILIVAGIFVVFIGIIYINYIDFGAVNWKDFSGRIFAALLIGVLSSLAVSLLVMTKGKKVD
ncbi:DUF4199 domain-containing protein [Mucilaginibacter ginsenosidivorans]|uniref:DUF4199 domain-containing protein n=1 Tax=Mucilaginibacter ginsenosidivorans TaxID=398053 RepID=A0A5B8URC7_9SPHI|nr:DUF4199 domain-containing protein [Mucilaginibacter ginsenosidivorans]QEC61637.1 DUF4199 domain-containing protein [Mucilaginibacter ginsenosidivorans]